MTQRICTYVYWWDSIDDLAERVASSENITELVFYQVSFADEDEEFDQLIKMLQTRRWHQIAFRECRPLPAKLLSVVLEQTECLELRSRPMHQVDETLIATALTTSSRLKRLHLFGAEWSGPNFHLIAEGLAANTKLEEFSVNFTSLRNTEIDPLCQALRQNTTLQKLTVKSCMDLQESAVEELIQVIQDHPNLRRLGFWLGGCSPRMTAAISTLLSSNHCHELDFSPFPTFLGSYQSLIDLSPLTNALRTNTSLISFCLSYNPVSDVDMEGLASALQMNTTLEELDLNGCKVTDNGIQFFAEALPNMKSLKTLHLDSEQQFCEASVAERLEDGLRQNTTLEYLSLSHKSESRFLSPTLCHYLDANRGGRRLLAEWGLPSGLWPHVLARASKIMEKEVDGKRRAEDILYCLLQGPVLLER
jgi:hypothetical protein